MSKGVLVDLTRCFGCGACTVACKLWNEKKYDDARKPTLGENAKLCDINWTVVNSYKVTDASGAPLLRFAKKQCLHCNEPACASSCLVGALRKTEEGPVIYHPDLCVGCRYCMVACPFNMAKYEWDRAFPEISRCQMCSTRVAKGEMPACVAVCSNNVMKFGDREELLKEARGLIASESRYVKHIYGEKEVGGTSWMYVSDQPFEKLAYNMSVIQASLPALTWKILNKIPVAIVGWTGIISGLYAFSKRRERIAAEKNGTKEASHD